MFFSLFSQCWCGELCSQTLPSVCVSQHGRIIAASFPGHFLFIYFTDIPQTPIRGWTLWVLGFRHEQSSQRADILGGRRTVPVTQKGSWCLRGVYVSSSFISLLSSREVFLRVKVETHLLSTLWITSLIFAVFFGYRPLVWLCVPHFTAFLSPCAWQGIFVDTVSPSCVKDF